jgi:hypothetical protein
MDKIFTPREVDALLPKLESIFMHMDALQKRTHELAATRPPVSAQPSASEVADSARIRSQMEFLLNAVHADIELVAQLGGVVKDIDTGLVDFLGRVEGGEVWLCWKRGENKIRFWHSLHAGYSERQTLRRGQDRTGTTH